MAKSPARRAAAAKNWAAAMANGQTAQNYAQGIKSCEVNPMAEAAKNEAGYLAGVQQAVADGSWSAALLAVPQQTWVQNASTIGMQRLASGAQKALPKYAAFVTAYTPVWDRMTQAAAAITGPPGMARANARFSAAMQVLFDARQAMGRRFRNY